MNHIVSLRETTCDLQTLELSLINIQGRTRSHVTPLSERYIQGSLITSEQLQCVTARSSNCTV